jgi:hypothetical protein
VTTPVPKLNDFRNKAIFADLVAAPARVDLRHKAASTSCTATRGSATWSRRVDATSTSCTRSTQLEPAQDRIWARWTAVSARDESRTALWTPNPALAATHWAELRYLRSPSDPPRARPAARQKWLAAAVIAGLATAVAVSWRHTPCCRSRWRLDAACTTRCTGAADGGVATGGVLIAIDEESLERTHRTD